MTSDRARGAAGMLAAAGFALLLLAHPTLASRDALWPATAAAVAGGAAALYLAGRAGGGAPRPGWRPPLAVGLAYLAAMSASVVFSPAPDARLAVPAGQVAFLWVGWWLGSSGRARHWLAAVAVAGGAAAGLYGLLQFAGLDPLPRPEAFTDRVLSLFCNPNHFGDFAAAVLPLALAAFLWPALAPGCRGAVPAGLALRLAAVGTTYAGLLLAGSRGAYWAFGSALLVLGAGLLADGRSRRLVLRRGPLLACLGLAVAVIALLHRAPIMAGPSGPVTVAQRLGASTAVLDGGAGDATLAHRLFLWRAAVEMIRQDPVLGAGYGQFPARLSEVREHLRHDARYTALRPSQQAELTPYAHNEYLHLWAETGVLGLGAFLALVAAAARSLGRALGSTQGRASLWAAAAALTALLVHGLVSYPLHMAVSSYVLWLLLGISFSLKDEPKAADKRN